MADTVLVRQAKGAVRLNLRVKPGSRHERLIGAFGDCLKLEVRAAPERGKANTAVSRLLAAVFDVKATDVVVIAGSASRDKVVEIRGTAAGSIIAALRQAGIAASAG